jgi:hypothetical protein
MHDSEVRGSLARAEAEAGESNPQALPSPPHHTPHTTPQPLDFYNADTVSGAMHRQPTQSTTVVYIH